MSADFGSDPGTTGLSEVHDLSSWKDVKIPKYKDDLAVFLIENHTLLEPLLQLTEHLLESYVSDLDNDHQDTVLPEVRIPWLRDILRSLLAVNGPYILQKVVQRAEGGGFAAEYDTRTDDMPKSAGESSQADWHLETTKATSPIPLHTINLLSTKVKLLAKVRGWRRKLHHDGRTYFVYDPVENMAAWNDPAQTELPKGWVVSNGSMGDDPIFADTITRQDDTNMLDPYHQRTCPTLPFDWSAVHLDELFFLHSASGTVGGDPRDLGDKAEETNEGFTHAELDTTSHISEPDPVSNTGSPYIYKPIVGQTFRLLRLKTADHDLICSIDHVSLESPPEYAALSYEWGSSDKSRKCHIEDDFGNPLGYIGITPTLHKALSDVARADSLPKTIFADQVAIKQNDSVELGHQVRLMGRIYGKATVVVTYEPGDNEDFEEGISLLSEMQQHFEPLVSTTKGGSGASDDLTMSRYMKNLEAMRQFPKFKTTNDKGLADVRKIIWGGWTRRLWMASENVLNSHAVFLIGGRMLSWKIILGIHIYNWVGLVELNGETQSLSNPNNESELHSISIVRLWFFRLKVAGSFPGTQMFWGVVLDVNNLECSDARDKIYGLLSLTTRVEQLHMDLIPNYSESNTVHDVYRDFARAVCYLVDDLRLLEWAELMPSPDWPSWESWVPDLRVPRSGHTYMFSLPSEERKTSQCRFRSNRLYASGLLLGTIATSSKECPGSIRNTDDYDALLGIIQSLQTCLRSRTSDELYSEVARALTRIHGWMPIPGRADLGPEVAMRALLRKWHDESQSREATLIPLTQDKNEAADSLNEEVAGSWKRSIFTTEDQKMGLCNNKALCGDQIVHLYGGSSLYILRPLAGGEYRFIGCAFIDGQTGENGRLEPPHTAQVYIIV